MPASFRPILPAALPAVAALAAEARVDEDGAAARLARACSGRDDVCAGELVVWAWTFDRDRTQVLLVDHPRFDTLLPPGGRVEVGEHPIDAVRRELQEETALRDVTVDPRPALVDRVHGTFDDGVAYETFGMAFVVTADPSRPLVGEPGQAPAWYPLDRRPSRADLRHWERVLSAPP